MHTQPHGLSLVELLLGVSIASIAIVGSLKIFRNISQDLTVLEVEMTQAVNHTMIANELDCLATLNPSEPEKWPKIDFRTPVPPGCKNLVLKFRSTDSDGNPVYRDLKSKLVGGIDLRARCIKKGPRRGLRIFTVLEDQPAYQSNRFDEYKNAENNRNGIFFDGSLVCSKYFYAEPKSSPPAGLTKVPVYMNRNWRGGSDQPHKMGLSTKSVSEDRGAWVEKKFHDDCHCGSVIPETKNICFGWYLMFPGCEDSGCDKVSGWDYGKYKCRDIIESERVGYMLR